MNQSGQTRGARIRVAPVLVALAGLFLVGLSGCSSAPEIPPDALFTAPDTYTINEGDVLNINVSGPKPMSFTQEVRRDGRISLEMLGEVNAAGMTPAKLGAELSQQYSAQLQQANVTVTIANSPFPVYVVGAVLRPGRIVPVRPPNALSAVMEAGGFDAERADLGGVKVLRKSEGSKLQTYHLDLRGVYEGRVTKIFPLQPNDIVYVPKKFTWF